MDWSIVHAEVNAEGLYVLVRYKEGDADDFTLPMVDGKVIATTDLERKLYTESKVWAYETGSDLVIT